MKKMLLVISLAAITLTAYGKNDPNMPQRLYSFYTPSHAVFKDDWFLPSIKDDYEVIINFDEQRCESAKFCHEGWKKTTSQKIANVIEAIEDCWGQVFVYADIDIQFFRPTRDLLAVEMEGMDMVFQLDAPSGSVCSGFFACRANEKTLALFKAVAQYMADHNCSDQEAVNALIRLSNPLGIQWKHLSVEYFGAGTLTGKQWTPGKRLPIPQNIILHHANWTYKGGIDHKLRQLRYVRSVVNKRKK